MSSKQEKFIMSTAAHSTLDQVKCVVTVTGDTICQAVSFKCDRCFVILTFMVV